MGDAMKRAALVFLWRANVALAYVIIILLAHMLFGVLGGDNVFLGLIVGAPAVPLSWFGGAAIGNALANATDADADHAHTAGEGE